MKLFNKYFFAKSLFLVSVITVASCSSGSSTDQVSFSPASVRVGSILTLTSTAVDLSTTSAVSVNGTPTIILSESSSQVVVLVMPGSTTGAIVATTSTTSATSASNLNVDTTPAVPATQVGSKVFDSAASASSNQGRSVALSADGKTAIVGGPGDSSDTGAAWVYTYSSDTWEQQAKLVGTGATGAARQGRSVALSADGNTALVGGSADNSLIGGAWIFTRSNGTWTQQGSKLVPSDSSGAAEFGIATALSANGDTALIGGSGDNSSVGAVWVFTRSSGAWSQQGSKLTSSDGSGSPQFGGAVALSADGNTAGVGGLADNSSAGAAWVFTRSSGTWSQQGSKLVGTGATGSASQGRSIAISGDGNTLVSGGSADNSNVGAVWVFTRSDTTWSQQGSKLVGSGASGTSTQGKSVAISLDGKTILSGAASDGAAGAYWIFTLSSDTWSQSGSKISGTGNTGNSKMGDSIGVSADGETAILGGDLDDSGLGAVWTFST